MEIDGTKMVLFHLHQLTSDGLSKKKKNLTSDGSLFGFEFREKKAADFATLFFFFFKRHSSANVFYIFCRGATLTKKGSSKTISQLI